jgi:ABC-type transport system involved in cytochrome c biogenesis permease subunit
MATLLDRDLRLSPNLGAAATRVADVNPLVSALRPLASLKLTLVLLAAAIFLILAGTLAQAKAGMWEAIHHYFAAWFVMIDLQIFFPQAWFGTSMPWIYDVVRPGMKLPFPGGASIGIAMLVNLLAAHSLRFRSFARGTRLVAGLGALAFGVLFTWVVIALGDFRQGLSERPLLSWEATAAMTLLGAILTTCAFGGAAVYYGATASSTGEKRRWVQMALSAVGAAVSTLGCVLLVAFFNDVAGLRILWQLIQGTMAGVVLLGGCWLLFDKRAGIVLLHGGIVLMMLSQLFVNLWAVEERISVEEGDTAAFAFDTRYSELAIVATTDTEERHVVIPQALLEHAAASQESHIIAHRDLPFDVEVLRLYKNSELAGPKEGKGDNLATAGTGLEVLAVERPVGAGASSDAGVDMPTAYVKLIAKDSGKDLGTYLATTRLNEDQLEIGGQSYDFGLRFKREYKPYQVTLKDAKRENYPGSSKPKNYESTIQLVDASHGVDRPVKISMNNPFRYLGETFYQSGMDVNPNNGKPYSVFQVVTNAGWMTPYVACMIVAVGLIYQFVHTLMKFILTESPGRNASISKNSPLVAELVRPESRSRVKDYPREPVPETAPANGSWWGWFIPSATAMGAIILSLGIVSIGFVWPKAKSKDFDLYEFGRLPVVDQGRTKPFDSLARETLLGLSNRTTVYLEDQKKSMSAVEWLLLTIAKPAEAEELHILRIEHPDVIGALGLPEDRVTMRFSLAELRGEKAAKELQKQLELIDKKKPDEYTAYENKLAELGRRLQGHQRIVNSFSPQRLSLPSRKALETGDRAAQEQLGEAVDMYQRFDEFVNRSSPALAVPVTTDLLSKLTRERKWTAYSIAVTAGQFAPYAPTRGMEEDVPTSELQAIFAAFAKGDDQGFNEHVAAYHNYLDRKEPDSYKPGKLNAESYLSHYAPFGWSAGIPLYLLAFLLGALGTVAARRQLGSAAFWMLVIAFTVHTVALGTRIYISGRPPVTNLYSSAVFIGWAAVFMGLSLEGSFRLGVGNVIAAMAGLSSLLIADKLSLTERDTIGVMEAVLDTQFWLATHVVCITLGYASTFVAGLLGIVYIFKQVLMPTVKHHFAASMVTAVAAVLLFSAVDGFALHGALTEFIRDLLVSIVRESIPAPVRDAVTSRYTIRIAYWGVAGIIAPMYYFNRTVDPSASEGKLLARMIYGVVCFALLFSFVGTVLGGLWADDSWGRFWGWDPKENGALIIVLWNAFILHAKWDKLANERGLAVLAVLGNVVTSWSWFGTNLLGVGLHSYGFSKEIGVALAITVVTHMLIFGLGLLPKSLWWSQRQTAASV